MKPQAGTAQALPFGHPLPFPRQKPVFSPGDAAGIGERGSKPARILVVEDDFLIAMEIETALGDAGFAVVGIAVSAEEALHLAKLHTPALAVMDIRLVGRRDGVDTALELFRLHGIRCIFATAHSDADVSRRAQPARPLGWLQKPYTATSLVEAVRAALREVAPDGRPE